MLRAPPRTEGGRRVYGPSETRVLAFIRRARELGFSLDDIRALLALGAPAKASWRGKQLCGRACIERRRNGGIDGLDHGWNAGVQIGAVINPAINPGFVRQMNWAGDVVLKGRYTYVRNSVSNFALDNMTPYIATPDSLEGGGAPCSGRKRSQLLRPHPRIVGGVEMVANLGSER
jgi:hypothetical protein